MMNYTDKTSGSKWYTNIPSQYYKVITNLNEYCVPGKEYK